MTKEQLVEAVQRRLGGGEVTSDVQGKYPFEAVAAYVEMAYNQMLFELAKIAKATRDTSTLTGMAKTFEVTDFIKDEDRDQYYIVNPVSIPQLPNAMAIREIRPIKAGSKEYIYRDPASDSIFDELDVNVVDQSIRYQPENSRIYFKGMTDDKIPSKLLLRVVVGFDGYDEDEDIHVPAEQDVSLLDMTVKMLLDNKQEDTINDTTLQ